MIVSCSLQTGSNGNCFYVETPDTRLIIDAGISGKAAQQRLADKSRDIWSVDAILITHDHIDHSGNAGTFQRKIRKPLYMTGGSWQICRPRVGVIYDGREFSAGEILKFRQTTIETIPTPHDGADGVAYVISYGEQSLGIMTDLGYCFEGLGEVVSRLDAVYIESNYDPEMLKNGPYPPHLQNRITGDGGHISNEQAAELIFTYGNKLQWAVLSHLSEKNNSPKVALETAQGIVGDKFPLWVAPRHDSFKMLTLD
ncbi:MAG: MBL fold metallo-hydrolase [Sedimentisphaerales bacterium]|nr:MBL fold metallo-hydrolase [Sedimentisphaerales bacterium]